MQNIDPLYFLTPLVVIGFSVGLVIYWRVRRRFSGWVLLLSLVAYAGAIILKEVFQYFTLKPFESAIGGNSAALGAYFGLQTVVFEVGGAFLVAWYAFSHSKIGAKDAEGYGVGLAFWENGVLIGGSLLVNYIIFFAALSGGGLVAQQLLDSLSKSAPALFYSPSSALPLVGFAILERVSSLLIHFSWGFLVIFAVAFKKKLFLWLALPMGFIDFLVPYSGSLGVTSYEALVFGLSLLSLVVALVSTKTARINALSTPSPSIEVTKRSKSLLRTNFKRAVSFGRIYLIIAIVIPLLIGGSLGGVKGNMPPTASIVSELFPLELPLFAALGGVGGLIVFVSDRTKGVYEYLIAYGVSTFEIFWSTVIVTLGLVTITLVASLAGNTAILLLTGGSMQPAAIELLLTYSIPLSYAAAAFMSIAGMVWSFLTVRVTGVNSPVGIAPILGIAPVLVVLLLSGVVGPSNFMFLTAGATVFLVAAVMVMMIVANKKMVRERLLSDA